MLSAGNGAITYDAENRVRTAGGVTYTYDGDGKRVLKSNGTLYWTGVGSETLDESDLSGTMKEEYVIFNGGRVSRIDLSTGTVHAFLTDHLGSSRMMVTPSGPKTLQVEQDLDYTPYGIVASGNAVDHYEFTGKERDSESGLDMFGARYYGSSLGRFMTPDWAARPTTVPYASFGDPQTLNLYGYVRNNPLSRADFDGHGWWSDLKERFGNSWKYGEVVTNAELPAAFERERQWLVNNVAANSGQVDFLRGASTSTINGIYQKWDQAISKAASGELVYGAKDFVRGSDGNLALASMYRGGPYTVRPGTDVKVDAVGSLKPDGLGRWRGLSVNEDPAKVSKFGEVTEVQMLPPELEFTQIGAAGHWEITNKGPMTLERYIDLMKDIVRKPLEDPIE